MLIDEFLPSFHARGIHARTVHAPVPQTYRAVAGLDLGSTFISRALLRLRGIPRTSLTITGLDRVGYRVLGERVNEELLLGLVGRFWLPRAGLRALDPESFRQFEQYGFAKAVWNFTLTATEEGTELVSETRVLCFDDWSRREFRIYWSLVAEFSAKTCLGALKTAKDRAERAWDDERGAVRAGG